MFNAFSTKFLEPLQAKAMRYGDLSEMLKVRSKIINTKRLLLNNSTSLTLIQFDLDRPVSLTSILCKVIERLDKEVIIRNLHANS